MKEKIKLKIPGLLSKKTIEFSDSFIEHSGKRVSYKNIIGLSYQWIKHYVNFIPTGSSYHVVIKDNANTINIDFSSSLFSKNKECKTLFSQVVYIVEKFLKPFLFINLVNRLRTEGHIKIGPLILATKGLSKERFLRRSEFLPWQDYELYKVQEGNIVVYKKDYKKEGHYRQFCIIPLSEVNAVILSELAYYLKNKENIAEEKKKESIINLHCPNCGTKIKEGVNFCTRCGKK